MVFKRLAMMVNAITVVKAGFTELLTLAQTDAENCDSTSAETIGSGPAIKDRDSTLTLQSFIVETLGNRDDDILHRLQSDFGITELDPLIYATPGEMDELCTALGLDIGATLKLKAAARKLQKSLSPQSDERSMIIISSTEQALIEQLIVVLQRTDAIEHIFDDHVHLINGVVNGVISDIDSKIDTVIESLESRRVTLHQQVAEWKVNKLQSTNEAMINVQKNQFNLQKGRKTINQILSEHDVVDRREIEIQNIINGLLTVNEQLKMYRDDKGIVREIMEQTKLIAVQFSESLDLRKLDTFGSIIDVDTLRVPLISLQMTNDSNYSDDNGFNVHLEWNVVSDSECLQSSGPLMLQYAVSNGSLIVNGTMNETATQSLEWSIWQMVEMDVDRGNLISIIISDDSRFGKMYHFQLECNIKKPFIMKVRSNMVTVFVEELGDSLLTSLLEVFFGCCFYSILCVLCCNRCAK